MELNKNIIAQINKSSKVLKNYLISHLKSTIAFKPQFFIILS